MTAHKRLTIGLFGFGVVGEGVYKVLEQTSSLNATIKKVCIKNPGKKRNAPAGLFTTDRNELLNDGSINVIVEVINESEPAFEIISTALQNGKAVVSASKKMIAEHLPQILKLQEQTDLPFLCEAAACASIPVIRNLEEYYDNDMLQSLRGIVNGSTNYILTRMFEDKIDFKHALMQAQQLGFAEADPKLDVDGWDAVNKWVLLLCHAYGIVAHPDDVVFTGIQDVDAGDASVGREKNYEIRLVAQAKKLQNGKIAAFVLPQFVHHSDHLSFVKNEYNGVVIESSFADQQFFYGKGAGSFPTACAVLSDISALRYDYRYEYKKRYHHTPGELTYDFYVKAYVSFENLENIPHHTFEWIEEWHANEGRKYLVAVMNFNMLKNTDWWKLNNTSLILLPDPIIEDVEIRKLKKKSLQLAGLVR